MQPVRSWGEFPVAFSEATVASMQREEEPGGDERVVEPPERSRSARSRAERTGAKVVLPALAGAVAADAGSVAPAVQGDG